MRVLIAFTEPRFGVPTRYKAEMRSAQCGFSLRKVRATSPPMLCATMMKRVSCAGMPVFAS